VPQTRRIHNTFLGIAVSPTLLQFKFLCIYQYAWNQIPYDHNLRSQSWETQTLFECALVSRLICVSKVTSFSDTRTL